MYNWRELEKTLKFTTRQIGLVSKRVEQDKYGNDVYTKKFVKAFVGALKEKVGHQLRHTTGNPAIDLRAQKELMQLQFAFEDLIATSQAGFKITGLKLKQTANKTELVKNTVNQIKTDYYAREHEKAVKEAKEKEKQKEKEKKEVEKEEKRLAKEAEREEKQKQRDDAIRKQNRLMGLGGGYASGVAIATGTPEGILAGTGGAIASAGKHPIMAAVGVALGVMTKGLMDAGKEAFAMARETLSNASKSGMSENFVARLRRMEEVGVSKETITQSIIGTQQRSTMMNLMGGASFGQDELIQLGMLGNLIGEDLVGGMLSRAGNPEALSKYTQGVVQRFQGSGLMGESQLAERIMTGGSMYSEAHRAEHLRQVKMSAGTVYVLTPEMKSAAQNYYQTQKQWEASKAQTASEPTAVALNTVSKLKKIGNDTLEGYAPDTEKGKEKDMRTLKDSIEYLVGTDAEIEKLMEDDPIGYYDAMKDFRGVFDRRQLTDEQASHFKKIVENKVKNANSLEEAEQIANSWNRLDRERQKIENSYNGDQVLIHPNDGVRTQNADAQIDARKIYQGEATITIIQKDSNGNTTSTQKINTNLTPKRK